MPKSNVKIIKGRINKEPYSMNTTTFFYTTTGTNVADVIDKVFNEELKDTHEWDKFSKLDFIQLTGI